MVVIRPTDQELVEDFGETSESLSRMSGLVDLVEKENKLPDEPIVSVRRRGRPKVFNQLEMITWRAEHSQRELMDASAKRHGESRAEFLRKAVNLLLESRGELTPANL